MKKTLLLILLAFPFMMGSLKSQDKAPSPGKITGKSGSGNAAIMQGSQEGMVAGDKNFTSFNSKSKIIDEELVKSTKTEFQAHPEFGILPYNSPCDDCFEVLEKRTKDTRYFVKKGTNGTEFYAQQGFGALHYKDNNGRWRAIDYHLVPHPAKPDLYWAPSQIYPTKIDLNNKNYYIFA